MVKVNVGDQVVYRVNKGRGRPAVGEVVRNRGILVDIRNLRNDEVVAVSTRMITREYSFKPYNTKRRQAEVALMGNDDFSSFKTEVIKIRAKSRRLKTRWIWEDCMTPELKKAGSGCVINGVKYKWRLTVDWDTKKKLNLSECKGKYYMSSDILFTNRKDAHYFFIQSF